jgi:folate-binding protein YgfZ
MLLELPNPMSHPATDAPSPLLDRAAWGHVNQGTVVATGSDAIRFVDNFVTASVGALSVGGGTESFVTDARGHVIALVVILRTEDGLEIVTAPGHAERLRDHLEHFHIREAVSLADVTADTAAILVAGPGAADALTPLLTEPAGLPAAGLAHNRSVIAGHAVRIVRVIGQGADGYWVRGAREALIAVAAALADAGLPQVSGADLDSARIEACYPSISDITEKTLPQELGRDGRAISFTKGCYLGQETVARLDALGHVNRRLALVAIEADSPPVCPVAIRHGDDVVGTLTSSCLSPRTGTPLGLGIIHTKALAAAPLLVGDAPARVVAIPPAAVEKP